MSETERPRRNFYGRLKGKSLKKSQKTYIDEDLDALSPGAVDWDANPDRTPLDLDTLFDGRKVWLEIGFGGGEHLVHQAGQNPDVGIIGCEVSESVRFEAGNHRHHWGKGWRSLWLDRQAAPLPFARLVAETERIHYTHMVARTQHLSVGAGY